MPTIRQRRQQRSIAVENLGSRRPPRFGYAQQRVHGQAVTIHLDLVAADEDKGTLQVPDTPHSRRQSL